LPITAPPLDADRLWADIMALAEITDPGHPYTRRSFTPLFLKGREWLADRFAAAGLTVRIDPAGNLIGRVEGQSNGHGVIAIGSHSDTVPSGGRFDGIAGLIAGLEVVRTLRDQRHGLAHALEIIDFLAEEPSDFGLSCVGSRGMAGALQKPMLAMPGPDGETLGGALRRVGGDPDRLDAARRHDIAAFLELHIEQGKALESRALDIGIVTSIVGIRRLQIEFEGAADHAGTTAMTMRHDALVAAAATVGAVRSLAEQLSAVGADYFVATVGMLNVEPGASNVVPGRCRLVIDVRTTNPELTERFAAAIESESSRHAAQAAVSRAPIVTLSNAPPAVCDPALRKLLHSSTRELGLGVVDLASGAGHDTAFMTRVCPSAMVFVPCRNGKSHAPEEWADRAAIAAGAAVMLETVKMLDRCSAREAASEQGVV
jgi:beta-ureidopropionase / N-carbamoyl-L-amino-acid hydrolase